MPPRRGERKGSREERVEDALRPCRTLGYDRDALALHMMEKEMFALAEAQLRRAIWLNPYEPAFKAHLAWCLYRLNKLAEALECARQALAHEETPETKDLLTLIQRGLDEATERTAP